ncbi:MAG: efflux RND transporter periplasmic adaptor subunit [Candidatus Latescibacteria bacterium]|nr:efflux RND transporter periplasmic adaptor subunit [bacterium]MBD3423419.1 efflux RND transporter periplasmic adaptor subunit [Candidatus Latescibacterota bacterium]
MKKKYWLLIGIVVVVAVLIIINLRARKGGGVEVEVEQIERRDLSMIISASGSIRPKRKIDVSASVIGKITEIAVEEGDTVRKGQFLMQIDPAELESSVMRLEASVESARAARKQALYQLKQRENELNRARKLYRQGFRTDEEVETAETAYEVAVANYEASQQNIAQQQAMLKSARHDLNEVTINAGMDGVVTRLNVEEGETAIMGTINNPGTVLMTIADLSRIETEVEVDETEVVYIDIGDPAEVTLDAYPDTTYLGEVTEIGNSPIYGSSSISGQRGVDFKVVITLTDTIPGVRPGLSADSDIIVARRDSALSIPIQSLTVRQREDLKNSDAASDTTAESSDVEGVFVVEGSKAVFRVVRIGISGSRYFEVLSGVDEGQKVVSGDYKAIRELRDGQRVEIK